MEYKPKYEQKISSYNITFWDMDGKEIEIDLPSHIWSDIDQAIYEWETGDK